MKDCANRSRRHDRFHPIGRSIERPLDTFNLANHVITRTQSPPLSFSLSLSAFLQGKRRLHLLIHRDSAPIHRHGCAAGPRRVVRASELKRRGEIKGAARSFLRLSRFIPEADRAGAKETRTLARASLRVQFRRTYTRAARRDLLVFTYSAICKAGERRRGALYPPPPPHCSVPSPSGRRFVINSSDLYRQRTRNANSYLLISRARAHSTGPYCLTGVRVNSSLPSSSSLVHAR